MSLRIRKDSLGRAELLGDVGDDELVRAAYRGKRKPKQLAMGLPPERRGDDLYGNPFDRVRKLSASAKPNPFANEDGPKPNPFGTSSPMTVPPRSNPFDGDGIRPNPFLEKEGDRTKIPPVAPPPVRPDGSKPNPFEALLSAGAKTRKG